MQVFVLNYFMNDMLLATVWFVLLTKRNKFSTTLSPVFFATKGSMFVLGFVWCHF